MNKQSYFKMMGLHKKAEEADIYNSFNFVPGMQQQMQPDLGQVPKSGYSFQEAWQQILDEIKKRKKLRQLDIMDSNTVKKNPNQAFA